MELSHEFKKALKIALKVALKIGKDNIWLTDCNRIPFKNVKNFRSAREKYKNRIKNFFKNSKITIRIPRKIYLKEEKIYYIGLID